MPSCMNCLRMQKAQLQVNWNKKQVQEIVKISCTCLHFGAPGLPSEAAGHLRQGRRQLQEGRAGQWQERSLSHSLPDQ